MTDLAFTIATSLSLMLFAATVLYGAGGPRF